MKINKTNIILILIAVLLLAGGSYFGVRYLINERFVSKYEKGEYENLSEEALFKLNLYEKDLPYYNMGNAAYQNGEYQEAEDFYLAALNEKPAHKSDDDNECNIRINLALSMLQQINYEKLESNPRYIQKAIDKLEAARAVLTETGCANPEDAGGHNEDAEQLKKEIDDLIDKLKNQQQNNQNNNNNDNNQNNNNNDNNQNNKDKSQREKSVQDRLEKERKESYEQGRESQNEYSMGYDEFGGGISNNW